MTTGNPDLPPQPLASPGVMPHRPADDSEEVYFQGRPLLRGELGKLIGCVVVGLLLIAIPFAYHSMTRDHVWPARLVTLVCILLGLIVTIIPWMQTKTISYRISNYRIDVERGLIGKNIDTLELWHVEDIRMHQSVLDRIAGVGTITVISHDDTTPKLDLESLPNPRQLFETLKQRVIAVKRQRGVLKMDGGF